MLSGGFFDDDPFFAGHRQQMQQMNQMFSPFGFPPGGMLALGAPQPAVQAQQRGPHRQQQQQLAPMDLFSFGGFGNMFHNMRRMMDDMHATLETGASNPNGQMYSQSTFVSYSNIGGSGSQPKVYQASSSTVQGPGGVRETRKMMRDSESGVEKMSMGRHIGQRGHVVERQRNRRTGDREENQEYINIDEEEAPEFNREWQEQSRQMRGAPGRLEHRRQDRADRRFRALPAPGQRHTHSNGHGHGHHHTNHNSTGHAGHSTHSTPRTPSYRDRE